MPAGVVRPARDPSRFREILGHVPTAVSVVTAMTPAGPVGMTVGSFMSISLEPPLVGFFVISTSRSAEQILQAGRFTANVLTDTQSAVSAAFASRTGNRFDGLSWRLSAAGSPHLAGALAWVDCTVRSAVAMGDHTAILGNVDSLEATQQRARPLVFFRSGYCRLDNRSIPRPGDWQLDHYAEW